MLERILEFAIAQRLLMVVLWVAIAALGVMNFMKLPIDAVPDITNKQVQVNTAAPAMSPQEVEKQITFPVEWAMGGIPGVKETRSLSKYGLSQVTVIFDDETDIYLARQLVNERLVEARESLPPGIGAPIMGPIATGLGEIYMWVVSADKPKPDGTPYDLTDLRGIQDWIVRPQMRTVPGLAEVNSIGGFERQYQVKPDVMRMTSFGISFHDIVDALAANNSNLGAAYIEHNGEQYLVRVVGQVETLEHIDNVKLGTVGGVPFFIKDVAEVSLGRELRGGGANYRGQETVLGTAIMLMGQNSRVVSRAVDKRLSEINKTLPDGVTAKPVYDRTYLIDATLKTVSRNLFEGAVLVIVILFLLLGHVRAALIVALAIPLAMLFAVTGMVHEKISGNLMSLGAIDFGLIVDGTVVLVENVIRHLATRQHELGRVLTRDERMSVVREASIEVRRPTLFGELIIAIVYLPILTLSGVEGKMFVPMAQVVLLALAGALLLTFTLVPALAALILAGRISEKENIFIYYARRLYNVTLNGALRFRWAVLGFAGIFLTATLLLATGVAEKWSDKFHIGTEFIPKLNEGAMAIEGFKIPSINIDQSLQMQIALERVLRKEFPDEIADAFSKTGTAEVAVDPDGPENSDTYVVLKPLDQWKRAHTPDELQKQVVDVLSRMPGQGGDVSQPIQMRFNDLIAGVRTDLGIKVYGDDMDQMLDYARKIKGIIKDIPGSTEIDIEKVTGLPVLTIDMNRKALARYGLNVKDVQDVIATAIGGSVAGQVHEGDRRFDLVVRLSDSARNDIRTLDSLPIPLPKDDRAAAGEGPLAPHSGLSLAGYVPLGEVAHIELVEGPNRISRENGKRRIVVQCNVKDRDLDGFVAEARQKVEAGLGKLPEGYWIGWGGQFENLIAARQRLSIVVPLALALIFLLLFASFNSFRHALLVFTGVPLALTGGVLAIWLRGIPFSISAGVGFIALSGVAVLNGLVMLTFIHQLQRAGKPLREAIVEGSMTRLRPILMTALVASLGFLPMALATGTGAEVQRPLATVVIGGLISATLLTLFVLPVLYTFAYREK